MERLKVPDLKVVKRAISRSPHRRRRREATEASVDPEKSARYPSKDVVDPEAVLKLNIYNVKEAPWLCDFCKKALLVVSEASLSMEVLPRTKLKCHWDVKWSDLERSATVGCHFCRIRYYRAKQKFPLEYLEGTWIRMYLGSAFMDEYEIYCEYWKEGVGGIDPSTRRQSFSLLQRQKDAPVVKAISLVGNNSESSQALTKAQKWLENCEASHKLCAQSGEKDFLPTRLLDVGTEPNLTIRVVEGCTIPSGTPYCTLSHCWPSPDQMLKLTKDNIKDFMQNIEYESLPRGFQDAISLCRRFGTRYLWIDSLCIVQGDSIDWKRESNRMREVYASGRCNIVLAGNKGDNRTSYATRDGLALTPFAFEGAHGHTYLVVDDQIWESNLTSSRLYSRGWCIQELVLAPRKLILGREQLAWACPESIACETYPDPQGIPISTLLRNRRHKADILLHNFEPRAQMKNCLYDLTGDVATRGERFWAWAYIVTDFARADLTFPEVDRLVAINGVARRLMKGSNYVWGFPQIDIILELLWKCTEACKKYGSFPTWSWASAPKGITYHQFDGIAKGHAREDGVADLCEVLQMANSTNRDANSVPRPLGRSLIILGPLWFGVGSIYLEKSQTASSSRIVELGAEMTFDEQVGLGTRFIRSVDWRVFARRKRLDVVLAPLMTEYPVLPRKTPWGAHGLILRGTGNIGGQYARIGHFQLSEIGPKHWKASVALSKLGNAPSDGYMAVENLDKWGNQRYRYEVI